ncbi:MAG: Arc family DNA-binding protein [Candidatus Riflebacteria bacterium]|nr:Arc family DNA-binding protein [Candidatus Riflebacteria bacterium]
MATLTIKDVPDSLYRRLKARAAKQHRSINSEVIVCLERELLVDRPDPEKLLARIDRLRLSLALPPVSEDLLREAKAAGRS